MNPLTAAWRKLTYRTEHATPHPATGLHITRGRWGGRTVHDPRLSGYLHARRMRLLREGFDPVDRALLDRATLALMTATADDVTARYVTSYLSRPGNLSGQDVPRSMVQVGS
jgi:hypothetical protein